jgi:pilus assembly protein CpaB
MKLFRVLVLGVALIAGGFAAYLALNMAPGAVAPAVVELPPQIPTQDVLVAAVDIGQGQTLTSENIRWQQWPEAAMNPGFIQKQTAPEAVEELQGSVVRDQFAAGEPIREVKLARPESGFLSAILPSGKRAIAVQVSAQNTAGGFILPNDRVDVIQTVGQQTAPDGPSRNVSRTILRNVKVLAIDQTIEEQEGEAVVVGKTATLELTPAQVELITAAEASGALSLALRSFEDAEEGPMTVLRPESPPPSDERTSTTIRIFRGGRLQELTIGLGDEAGDAIGLPQYDTEAYCRDAAGASGAYSEAAYAACLEREQRQRDQLQSSWGALAPEVRNSCDEMARAGGPGSYAALRDCVAQDVTAAADNGTEELDF